MYLHNRCYYCTTDSKVRLAIRSPWKDTCVLSTTTGATLPIAVSEHLCGKRAILCVVVLMVTGGYNAKRQPVFCEVTTYLLFADRMEVSNRKAVDKLQTLYLRTFYALLQKTRQGNHGNNLSEIICSARLCQQSSWNRNLVCLSSVVVVIFLYPMHGFLQIWLLHPLYHTLGCFFLHFLMNIFCFR